MTLLLRACSTGAVRAHWVVSGDVGAAGRAGGGSSSSVVVDLVSDGCWTRPPSGLGAARWLSSTLWCSDPGAFLRALVRGARSFSSAAANRAADALGFGDVKRLG